MSVFFSVIFLRFVFAASSFKQQLSMWECLPLAQSSRAVSNPSGGWGWGVAMTFCLSNTLYLHSRRRLIVCPWLHHSDCLLFGLILHGWKYSFPFKENIIDEGGGESSTVRSKEKNAETLWLYLVGLTAP